jgi:quercetin dioxygenase-like cupin family protein
MKFTKIADLSQQQEEKRISPLHIYDKEEGAIVHLTLQPDSTLPAHKTPVNVAFYVLEGTIRIDIGEESVEFGPDTIIESPKEIPHALTNTSTDRIARVLVIKMPRP